MANNDSILGVSEALVSKLATSGKMVATAESCTGGWIAKAITDVAGSSEVFAYGIVSYSNGAKESLLGVETETLVENGAVSGAVVEEMAVGALELSGADIAVAVSGIAGPAGGSPDKPVGTVWFAWAVRGGSLVKYDTDCRQFKGDRDRVREQTVTHALRGVRERIK
ncbi:MAG: CinA family protein [Gammaproteobacteria bacterium]|nr:CinA family protein [Gammaproteobacteria bacterium]